MPIDGYSFQLSSDVYQGGIDVVEMGQIKIFVQELGLKQGFLADTKMGSFYFFRHHLTTFIFMGLPE